MVGPNGDNVNEVPSGVDLLNRIEKDSLIGKSGNPYRYQKGGLASWWECSIKVDY